VGSVVEKTKMTQSAPTKVMVGCMLRETVQVAHHDGKSLGFRERR